MKLLIGIALILFTQNIIGQEFTVQRSEFLNFLYYTHEPIESITTNPFYQNKFISLENKQLNSFNQTFRKTSKGLFLLIESSGRLYKASDIDTRNIFFQRIDSTTFFGYNNSAIIFPFKDTLYSFGGFGFWKKNGQLRYYSESIHEWNIIKINKEVPALNNLNFIDTKNDNIFYIEFPFTEESTGKEHNQFTAIKFDLIKKENIELGQLNNKVISLFPETFQFISINIPRLHGTLVNLKNGIQYLLNFNSNQIFKLKNRNISDYFNGYSDNNQISNIFSTRDSIYFTKSNDSTYKLYSFPISMKDFVKEPYPLYEPLEDEKKKLYFYIGGLCMLLIGGSVFFVKKRKQKTTSINTEPSLAVSKKEDNGIDFNPLELELITKMIEQSARGNHFSVEDINSSLGLNRKTLEIQKKIRTETINRINHKFKIKYNLSIDLIERIRSEEDRRYYKYMISGENGKIVLS